MGTLIPELNGNSQGHFHSSLVIASIDKTILREGDLTIKLWITPVKMIRYNWKIALQELKIVIDNSQGGYKISM